MPNESSKAALHDTIQRLPEKTLIVASCALAGRTLPVAPERYCEVRRSLRISCVQRKPGVAAEMHSL
jgi:hypothetical protein